MMTLRSHTHDWKKTIFTTSGDFWQFKEQFIRRSRAKTVPHKHHDCKGVQLCVLAQKPSRIFKGGGSDTNYLWNDRIVVNLWIIIQIFVRTSQRRGGLARAPQREIELSWVHHRPARHRMQRKSDAEAQYIVTSLANNGCTHRPKCHHLIQVSSRFVVRFERSVPFVGHAPH